MWSQNTHFVASVTKLDGCPEAVDLSPWGRERGLLERTPPQNTKSTPRAASLLRLFCIHLPRTPLCPVLCWEVGCRQEGVALILEFTVQSGKQTHTTRSSYDSV